MHVLVPSHAPCLICEHGSFHWRLFSSPAEFSALAADKAHTIVFGKWITVKWMIGSNEDQPIDLKIRPLLVDGHAKEYTVGPS